MKQSRKTPDDVIPASKKAVISSFPEVMPAKQALPSLES